MGRRLVARHLGAEAPRGKDYKDDSLSFVAIKKVSSPLARTPTREGSGAQSALESMHRALEQKHKGVPMLAPALEPEVLNKEPELAAIVAAPGGAPRGPISSTRSDTALHQMQRIVTAPGGASKLVPSSTRSDKMAEPEALNRDPAPSWPGPVVLAMARIGAKYLAMSRWALATHAALQAKWGNPCFASKAAAASSLSQICLDCIWNRQCRNMGQPLPLPLSVRHGDARGAAREGSAGTCRPARQGRGDQRRQGGKRTGKAAGPRPVLVSGGGRRGPLAGAGRPTAGNPLRPGARACRLGGLDAWGMRPTSSVGVSFRALHLTGTGRLWMARFRLLLLRSGGQVGRRGRRG
jgi:hypothetical protein